MIGDIAGMEVTKTNFHPDRITTGDVDIKDLGLVQVVYPDTPVWPESELVLEATVNGRTRHEAVPHGALFLEIQIHDLGIAAKDGSIPESVLAGRPAVGRRAQAFIVNGNLRLQCYTVVQIRLSRSFDTCAYFCENTSFPVRVSDTMKQTEKNLERFVLRIGLSQR